ncbi:hypothetical protein MYCTH_101406 [Thermothelomyces thermophilus ATCC 42464]|uniref:Uncharacterized protein n=1 Tax=Thermothelomyces thermophilus (strain ATCC 42464 / BCRC 31852 / DSM 1799) TaxID=573729 RepID=G2QCF5_THET4|nr:uncharacterized protein MYCTH_101406 [Thermothelomyces thermophilus ATCC 42464]AEO58131.1 hypothetical protein MYCTH_101406 [Thermothelomyces thermophilus ATCC 42464]
MPRPKRSRVGATRPTRAPSPAPDGQAAEKAPTVAPAEVPGSDIYDVSDREKERINQRVAQAAKAGSHSRRTRASEHLNLNSEQAKALEDSRRRRDDAMDRLDDLTSTSRPNRSDSPDIEHSRRESVSEPQRRLTDASGLDLDDDIFANLDDSLDDTANSFEETRTGYRSADTSSINVAMFKRRPRQSSVAGRDDAPIRPSSRGQNTPSISTTLNFSNFKRRAREPSILGTGRKPRRARSQSVASQASRNPSITTADLTSLLPRRRHKESNRRTGGDDPFDPDASDDDRYVAASNGEDDVSYVDSRAAARRRKGQMALGRSTANRRAAKAATKPGNAGGKGRAIRTYGAANEDKENEEIQDEIVVASGDEHGGGEDEQDDALPEEETTRMMAERLGEELQKAAKKFKEVDKWELSFEEVTHSSSPGPDAR